MSKVSAFYSYSLILSYNAVYNFVVGGRGKGKTYGWKRKAIRDAIRTYEENEVADQFIYLRRYKEELRIARDTFFADIGHVFPDWDFRTQGMHAQMSPASESTSKKRNWITIGYFIPLSTAQSVKSASFPMVKNIGFDEFILEKSATHYLPNESGIFNNFYSTVDRYKDKTRVYFMANSVNIANPYFIEFKIDPDAADKNGIIKLYNGFVACHFIPESEFEAQVYETKFGGFIQGTDYADYAVGNQFRDNHKHMIAEKGPNARYQFTLETESGTSSIWYDIRTNKYYSQADRPKVETMFTIVPENMREGITLLTFNDGVLQMLRSAYRHDRLRFDQASTRNSFVEIMVR